MACESGPFGSFSNNTNILGAVPAGTLLLLVLAVLAGFGQRDLRTLECYIDEDIPPDGNQRFY